MQLMLDGFSGKHVKIFIDGVPQEGVGSSFGLNNIPVNFADRIEVYKGVVNPEKPDVPINKNDAFQKVQKRRVQEKR
jgi:hypothetical protein